jgi:hypothetical protein
MFCQDSLLTISGRVKDELTQQPLANVAVRVGGTLFGTSTDSSGTFILRVKQKETLLIFSIIGYREKIIAVNASNVKGLKVALTQESRQLDAVDINASKVQQVIKSKSSNVLDYGFEKDHLLLITYGSSFSKSRLVLLSTSFDTLGTLTLPEEPVSLFMDCLGNNHVVCEKSVYQVYTDNGKFKLLPAESLESFTKILYPCVASDSANLYFCSKSGAISYDAGFHDSKTVNTGLQYTFINKTTKQKEELAVIYNKEVNKQRKEELYNEMIKVRAEIPRYNPDNDRLFFETIYLKEIYAPLFSIKNTTFIFDHVNASLLSFSDKGTSLKSIPIAYHTSKEWDREVCVDPVSGRVFAVYESKGISTLKEINVENGTVGKSYAIPFSFVQHIKVYNNQAYFIYKNDFYYLTRALARMKLD